MDCSICGDVIGKEAGGWNGGHNAEPINDGRCCGTCNDTLVLQARIMTNVMESRKQKKEAVDCASPKMRKNLDALGQALGNAMRDDGYDFGRGEGSRKPPYQPSIGRPTVEEVNKAFKENFPTKS